MSIELLKDCINIRKNVSKNSSHFNITTDIILPDFKPDIKKILDCYEEIFIKSITPENNKVTISGNIDYNLLYYSSDFELNSINYSSKFSHEISLPSMPENSIFDAKISIENKEYEVLNERRILLKYVAVISLEHNLRVPIDVVYDILDDNNIQVLKENVYVPNYLGSECEKLFLKENIELDTEYPSLYQILKHNSRVKKISHKIVDGKVIVNGLFESDILYIPENNTQSIETFRFEKSLSQIVNIPDISDNACCDCSIQLSDITLGILENTDGEQRIIDLEVIFDVNVLASMGKNVLNIADAYSFDADIHIDRESIIFDDICANINENFYFKNTMDLNSPSSNLKIHDVDVSILFSEYKLIDSDVIIDGVLSVSTLFCDDSQDEKFKVLAQEYPFRHVLDYSYPQNVKSCNLKIAIDNVDYNINIENNLEFKININVNVDVLCNKSSLITTNLTKEPLDSRAQQDKPSIIVYFAHENDSLWKIAKKYRTTVANIKNINGLTNDTISPNQKILIM